MHMYKMRHIATDVALSVCLYVCLSVTTISCAKTDEPIEMLFGVWTRVFWGAPPAMRPFIRILWPLVLRADCIPCRRTLFPAPSQPTFSSKWASCRRPSPCRTPSPSCRYRSVSYPTGRSVCRQQTAYYNERTGLGIDQYMKQTMCSFVCSRVVVGFWKAVRPCSAEVLS